MTDSDRLNYQEKLLETAASKSIITEKQKDYLVVSWRDRKRFSSLSQLYAVLFALSSLGMVVGLVAGVREAASSLFFHALIRYFSNILGILDDVFFSLFKLMPIKAAILFLLGLSMNWAGDRLARADTSGKKLLAKPVYVFGAALHSLAMAYVVMQGVVFDEWEELEVTSAIFWAVIPLIMPLLGGFRPLLYQLLTGLIIVGQSLAFGCGVSGNSIIALNVCTAVILISAAQFFAPAFPRHAAGVRYMSMIIIGFLLYCTGFVWDYTMLLDFFRYIKPGSHQPTKIFLAVLFAIAVAAVAAAYFRKPGTRTRADGQFALLLLATLLFSLFATAILMQFITPGEIFNLFRGRFRQSIFSSRAVLALFLSWTLWFLWSLWLLVESRETGESVIAQIGVTVMLGSIEVRYVEICRNFSFTAALVMLPICLLLAAVSSRFLQGWLKELLPEGAGEGNAGSAEQ